jgi:hypothetical protein
MQDEKRAIRILLPTSLRHARPDPWELEVGVSDGGSSGGAAMLGLGRTDNERNHGCSISSGGLKTLDELLDLPDLNLFIGLLVSVHVHDGKNARSCAGAGQRGASREPREGHRQWRGKKNASERHATGEGSNVRSSRPRWRWDHSSWRGIGSLTSAS